MQLRGKVFPTRAGSACHIRYGDHRHGGCVLSEAPGIVGVWKGLSSDGGELIFTFRVLLTLSVQSYKRQGILAAEKYLGDLGGKVRHGIHSQAISRGE